jgi:integrase
MNATCRPTDDEIDRLLKKFESKFNVNQISMARVIKFAIATAMRQEEIFRVTWSDLNKRTKMLMIRDRKDPRQKKGNDQEIPLLAVSGYVPLSNRTTFVSAHRDRIRIDPRKNCSNEN